MKIKLIMLALCFSLILASCKVTPEPLSGNMNLDVSGTSVRIYHTDAFSKNKKQEIILVFWDNMSRSAGFESASMPQGLTDITCYLTKSDSAVKVECVGEFDGKTGKGKVKINDKVFDISNGRLFLINTHVKPLKVIQVNEQFNLPPFDDVSWLDDTSRFNMNTYSNVFSYAQEIFEYLAKNNKIVAAFLADSKKSSEPSKNKSEDLKKKN